MSSREAPGRSTVAAVRLHRWSQRWVDRCTTVLRGMHDGAWLGLASPHLLHAVDEHYYLGQAQYRDVTYNRSGLRPWEEAALDRFFEGRRRLVVTGAGGGREVLALLCRGVDAYGYECNPDLVDAANHLLVAEGFGARVSLMERDGWPAGASTGCDGVVVGWGSYMLTQGRAARVAFLAGARSALDAGAPVLVSFFSRRGDPGYFRLVARVAGGLRRARGLPPVEVGDTVRPNFLHCFTEVEIAGELEEAGFKPVWFAEEPYGHAVGLARP